MATAERKRMKAVMKAYPMKEMKKPQRDFIDSSAELKKLFAAPITYSETLELDARKWNERKLSDAMLAISRFEMMALATTVYQVAQKGGSGDKKVVRELADAYRRTEKQVTEKISDAMEELRNDDGDNKKALKEGKDLFADLDRVDWQTLFARPTAAVTGALALVVRDADKAADNPAAFRKSQLAAQKTVKAEIADFAKAEKEVSDALVSFDKLFRELRKNDDVAPELKAFGDVLHKGDKTFDQAKAACDDFAKALAEVETVLAVDDLDADDVKTVFIKLRSMSGPTKAAKAAIGLTKKLKQQFVAIRKKLT